MRTCELPEEEDEQLDDNFVVIVIVAAVVELGGQPFLFNRLLDRACFSPDGDLERITLVNAERRCVKDDEHNQQDSAYYAIAGDTFVLRLSEVKTVNFLYYAIMPGDDEFEGYQISDFSGSFRGSTRCLTGNTCPAPAGLFSCAEIARPPQSPQIDPENG